MTLPELGMWISMVETKPIFKKTTKDTIKHFGEKHLEYALSENEGAFESQEIKIYTPEILINDDKTPILSRGMFVTKYNSDGKTRNLIAKNEDIDRGNIYEIFDEKWLAISESVDEIFYRKIELIKCNYEINYVTESIKTIIGRDQIGAPIYDYQPGTTYNIPCVIDAAYYSLNSNQQLVVPDGQLTISLPYFNPFLGFEINKEVKLYDRSYKVIDHIHSEQRNKVGVLIIKLERIGNDASR